MFYILTQWIGIVIELIGRIYYEPFGVTMPLLLNNALRLVS
jgi:hypothetical protein